MIPRVINAGIVHKDDRLEFIWKKTPEDLISLTPGKGKITKKSPYLKSNLTYPIYSVYKVHKKGDYLEAVSTLKGKSSIPYNSQDRETMLRKGAIYMHRIISGFSPNLIIALPSSGTLVRDFTRHLKEVMSIPEVLYQSIEIIAKNPISEVYISEEADRRSRGWLESLLKKQKKEGRETLEIKHVDPMIRKYLKGVFKFSASSEKIENRRLLIIDDALTSGYTLEHAFEALAHAGVEDAVGLTLLKF